MSVSFPEQFNMATYFLDHNIEAGRGERTAVYFQDERYTYRQVYEMANRCGNALLSLGVEMEDRVLMVLPDSIEFVAVWFAIAKVGAVITMVNTIESKCLPVAKSFQSASDGHLQLRAH